MGKQAEKAEMTYVELESQAPEQAESAQKVTCSYKGARLVLFLALFVLFGVFLGQRLSITIVVRTAGIDRDTGARVSKTATYEQLAKRSNALRARHSNFTKSWKSYPYELEFSDEKGQKKPFNHNHATHILGNSHSPPGMVEDRCQFWVMGNCFYCHRAFIAGQAQCYQNHWCRQPNREIPHCYIHFGRHGRYASLRDRSGYNIFSHTTAQQKSNKPPSTIGSNKANFPKTQLPSRAVSK